MEPDWQVLVAPAGVDPAFRGTGALAALYAPPRTPWLRANMVSTLNGVAAGPDGRSGSINNAIDREVFALLRAQADAIVVGAGTARTEGYRPTDKPLIVLSRSGALPPSLRNAPSGSVVVATRSTAQKLVETRDLLADDNVWVLGADDVDLALLRSRLVGNGLRNILCEGGPTLLAGMLESGVVDEICLTWVPRMLGGEMQPLLTGAPIDLTLKLQMLLERNGTLLGRWLI